RNPGPVLAAAHPPATTTSSIPSGTAEWHRSALATSACLSCRTATPRNRGSCTRPTRPTRHRGHSPGPARPSCSGTQPSPAAAGPRTASTTSCGHYPFTPVPRHTLVFVASGGDNAAGIYDQAAGTVTAIPAGPGPFEVTLNPAGTQAWVSDNGGRIVT